MNSLPVYDEKRCALFALGRNAMYAACKAAGLKEGDEVLTPAFDCDGSLQPFRALGLRLRFYASNARDFSVDIGDIKKKVTPGTKLVHIINHFGMPQPWKELLAFRRESGIPILEDNAYSLFSAVDGERFGSFGDIAVFSLRKNLPLVDGGMLRVNNPAYGLSAISLPPVGRKAAWLYPTEIIPLLALIKTRLGWYKAPGAARALLRLFSPGIEPPPPLYSDPARGSAPDWPSRDHVGREFACDHLRPMSRLARMQLGAFSKEDYDAICLRKREAYRLLACELGGLRGVTVLWPELPEGVVPFSLSLVVEKRRDELFTELRQKYDVMVWPILPQAVLDELGSFPEVEFLGRKLLQLNLAADKVTKPSFGKYREALARDIRSWAEKT